MKNGSFNENEIEAYADNMLDPKETKRIKKVILVNPAAKKYYLELMHQKHLLKMWWKKSVN